MAALQALIDGRPVHPAYRSQFTDALLQQLAYHHGINPRQSADRLWQLLNTDQEASGDVDLGVEDEPMARFDEPEECWEADFLAPEDPDDVNDLCAGMTRVADRPPLLLVNPEESVAQRRTRLIAEGIPATLVDQILRRHT